jgi:nucleoside-diphosphate-sugar epimerase
MTVQSGHASGSAAGRLDGPVLVTGASGFVGACAVGRLLCRGHEVHLLLRSGARLWRLQRLLGHARIRIVTADLIDACATAAAVSASRPAVVLHLATEGAYEHQSDARSILTTNVLGTQNLLDASVKAGVRLFVNAGSSSEYGYKSRPMREDEVLQPNSHYAVAKAAQTHLVTLTSVLHDMPAISFRLFSVYGPWEEPTRLVPTLIRRARAGLPLIMTAPDTARDFVHVDDVLDALLDFDRLAAMRGQVFNLGTGTETTLREAVSTVLREVGSRSEVQWGRMAPRRWDTSSWCADASLAFDSIGWRARLDFAEGIRRTAKWMEEVGDAYGPDCHRGC